MNTTMIYNKRAYTLIEVLLTIVILGGIYSAMVLLLFGNWGKATLNDKVMEYKSLQKFVQCSAELSGKRTHIVIKNNKIDAGIEMTNDIYTPIFHLTNQISAINENTEFVAGSYTTDENNCCENDDDSNKNKSGISVENTISNDDDNNTTNLTNEIIVFNPDGSVEQNQPIYISVNNDTNFFAVFNTSNFGTTFITISNRNDEIFENGK